MMWFYNNKQTIEKQSLYILGAIFVLAVVIRLWFVSGNNVMFWFDQARDATIVESIINEADLKIQGPSAGGTDDTVFHGVLYYYFILPFYILADWSPQWVSYFLAIFASLAVPLIYFMGLDIFNKDKQKHHLALLAAGLAAVSFVHVQEGTWLSNPVLMILSVPLFFWMLWKVFFTRQDKYYLYLVFFFLGISNQAAIFTIYLFGSLLLAYLYRVSGEKKWRLFSIKQYFISGLIYLVTVSTMILTEVLMIYRGVLTLNILGKTGEHFVSGVELSYQIYQMYFSYLMRLLSPGNLLLLFIPALFLLYLGYKNLATRHKLFFLIFFLAPLWLLTWHFRGSLHLFIGISVVVHLLLAKGLLSLEKTFLGKKIFYFALILLIVVNMGSLLIARRDRVHMYAVQKGALLAEQLAVIDKTYQVAHGRPFSISSLSSPYGVNVTWAYLYAHHGLQNYGYLPQFFGPSQAGWFGDDFLTETDQALQVHFTIIEPGVYLGPGTGEQFLIDQTVLSSPVIEKFIFGSLILEVRENAQQTN